MLLNHPFFSISARFQVRFAALVTLALWCAAVASGVYWFLQFPQRGAVGASAVVPNVSRPTPSPPDASVGRALGLVAASQQAPTPDAARFQLLGVIASSSGQGSALISTDGLPPKAYRMGQVVADGLILADLKPRQVKLKSPGIELQIELAGSLGKP